jgi:transcriptional regulator with XRE-family HTH domain
MENRLLSTVEEREVEFGRAVRRLRLSRRITQAELAEQANVSLSAVKNLERGRGSSLSTVISVVRSLGRSEWLDSLALTDSGFSPMDLLRQRKSVARPQRVRHRTTTT